MEMQQQRSSWILHQNPPPSPADFVNMLAAGSSSQTHDFRSFASALVSRLRPLPGLSFHCPQCDTTSTAELALLFASQVKAFNEGHHSSAGPEANAPEEANVNVSQGPAVASPPSNAEAEKETQHPDPDADAVFENGSSQKHDAANVEKAGNSASPDNDETLVWVSVRNTMAPSRCDVAGGENSNGRATEPVFKVKRKSKNGEARELTLSDISPLFGLHLPNAAKELGISMSSLKKACRSFGLPRWPGRKIRRLESTIDGLERNVEGQGADSGNCGVAIMRSEIPKLQQELVELRHGTPAQIREKVKSPAALATSVYKRLYYVHGWRSKHHNPGRHASPPAGENSAGVERAATATKLAPGTDAPRTHAPPANQPSPIADKESAHPSPRKYIRPGPRRIFRFSSRLSFRDTEMKASDLEGLLPEVPESVVQAQNGNSMLTPKTDFCEEGTGDGKVAA